MSGPLAPVVASLVSGLGLGLIAWLGFGLGADATLFAWIAAPLALAAAALGALLSGDRPARPAGLEEVKARLTGSWRGRRGLFALAALALFAVYAALWMLFGARISWLGLGAVVAAVGALVATGMVHREEAQGPAKDTPLTVAAFVAFGLASGALTLAGVSDISGSDGGRADGAAVFMMLIAWALKAFWWSGTDKAAGSPAAKRVKLLRRVALIVGGALPILLIDLSGRAGAIFVPVGLASHLIGLGIERWMFFTPRAALEAGASPLDAAAPAKAENGAAADGDDDDGSSAAA